ncbi:hypothetical protein [Fulvivirga lutea]|uniref:Uncharacterized protein n=1 Tax=Fulvivirga lutea TaxID=2810512 RepID=A0A974WJL3_9BACT|nr:hypothetical protein [Fulvivirga lutea]QSE99154.1 hypothetical protein JR347_08715 [Fulvivirga lutea]
MRCLFLLVIICTLVSSCQNERKESTAEISTTQCTPSEIYDCFISDSIWFETYRHINNKLTRPLLINSYKAVNEKTGLDNRDLALLFFCASNLDSTGFNAPNFQLRYPFANRLHITGQFKKLVEEGLLEYEDARFHISEKGKKVIHEITSSIARQQIAEIKPEEVEIINHIFDQISNSDELENFPSPLERKKSLLSSKSVSNYLRLVLLMDDLVAMRNDASHYRIKRLNNELSDTISVSFPATEILASLSSKDFVYSDYSSRPTWGHSKEETNLFEEELIALNLAARKHNGALEITELGQALQSKSALNTEVTFYRPWLNIEKEALANYKSILLKLKN